jgi:NADP-dependent 3-hydroxy acid dehydrogenase YdfG
MNDHPLAVITGGSSGIGLAVSEKLADAGYQVINADKNPPPGTERDQITHLPCDTTKAEDIEKLSQKISNYSAVKILVLNAGRGIHEKIREGDPEKWSEIITLNICGTLRVLRAVLPFMGIGNVIFLSSVSAGNTYPYGGIYAATKSALEILAETLRLEEQPDIKVTVIAPGIVNTPFFKNMISGENSIEKLNWGAIEPEEIADAVLFAVNQKPNTMVNHIVIRPAKQVL